MLHHPWAGLARRTNAFSRGSSTRPSRLAGLSCKFIAQVGEGAARRCRLRKAVLDVGEERWIDTTELHKSFREPTRISLHIRSADPLCAGERSETEDRRQSVKDENIGLRSGMERIAYGDCLGCQWVPASFEHTAEANAGP